VAPAFIASTAERTEPLPVRTRTAQSRPAAFAARTTSRPSPSGRPRSVMQTSGAARARAATASATEPAAEVSYRAPERARRERARARLVLDDEDLHGGAPPSPAGAGRGHERSATSRPRSRRAGGFPVGFDAGSREEQLFGPLLALRQMEEAFGVRLVAPARASMRRDTRPGPTSALTCGGRTGGPGARRISSRSEGRRGMPGAGAEREEGPPPTPRGDPGDPTEIADRRLSRHLSRDPGEARQEVDQPACRCEIGLRAADRSARVPSGAAAASRRSRSSSFRPAAESGSARAWRRIPAPLVLRRAGRAEARRS